MLDARFILLCSLLFIGLALALLYLGRLFFRQQELIFRPGAVLQTSPADSGVPCQELDLTCQDGTRVHGWWLPVDTSDKVVIFFHGSDGNLTHELATLYYLHSLPTSVLALDYPGYGKSEGRPTERGCYAAAEAAWAFVRETKGFSAQDTIIYGQSLGSAVGTYLASTRACGGMVFQSGFTSVPEMAALAYPYLPVRFFCRTNMDSLKRISQCDCPVLMLHSQSDEHIPITQALRVYERAPGPKKFLQLANSHFDHQWRYSPGVRSAWEELLNGRVEHWERGTTGGGTLHDAARNQEIGARGKRIPG